MSKKNPIPFRWKRLINPYRLTVFVTTPSPCFFNLQSLSYQDLKTFYYKHNPGYWPSAFRQVWQHASFPDMFTLSFCGWKSVLGLTQCRIGTYCYWFLTKYWTLDEFVNLYLNFYQFVYPTFTVYMTKATCLVLLLLCLYNSRKLPEDNFPNSCYEIVYQ